MKKFSIQSLAIMSNKEKINIISLEHKNDKYILYSNTDSGNIDENFFIKMEFTENIQITPKFMVPLALQRGNSD